MSDTASLLSSSSTKANENHTAPRVVAQPKSKGAVERFEERLRRKLGQTNGGSVHPVPVDEDMKSIRVFASGNCRRPDIGPQTYSSEPPAPGGMLFVQQSLRSHLSKSMSVTEAGSNHPSLYPLNKSMSAAVVGSPKNVTSSLVNYEDRIRRKINQDYSRKEKDVSTTKEALSPEIVKIQRVPKFKSRRDLFNEKLAQKRSDQQPMFNNEFNSMNSSMHRMSISAGSLDEKIRLKNTKKSKKYGENIRKGIQVKPRTVTQTSFGSRSSATSIRSTDHSETSWDDLAEVIQMTASESLSESLKNEVHNSRLRSNENEIENENNSSKLTFQDIYAYSSRKANHERRNRAINSSFTIRDLAPRNNASGEDIAGGRAVESWSDLEDVLRGTAAESMSMLPDFSM